MSFHMLSEYDNDPLMPSRRMKVTKGKQIKSMGRVTVCAPQIPLVLQGDADWEAYGRFSRGKNRSLYPVGDESNFDLLRGELAFHYANQPINVHNPNPNFMAAKVKTAFNGESLSADLVFAGVVDKEYIRAQQRDDTAVTLRKGGSHTIVNTGPDPIPQGYKVYWAFPDVMTTMSGETHPIIDIRGVPPKKFLATLRPLDQNSIFGAVTAVVDAFMDAHGQYLGGGHTEAEKRDATPGILQTIERLVKEFSLVRDADVVDASAVLDEQGELDTNAYKSLNPLRRLLYAFLTPMGIETDVPMGFPESDHKTMHFIETAHAAQGDYGKNLVRSQAAYKKRRRRPATDALDTYEELGDREEQRHGRPATSSLGIPDSTGPAVVVAMKFITRQVAECVLEIVRLLERRVIGTALSSAMPGKQFDIMLAYYH